MFNMTDIVEIDDNNWVAISYCNETADGKLIGRTYKVVAEVNGKKDRTYFSAGTVSENKATAYAKFYQIENDLTKEG